MGASRNRADAYPHRQRGAPSRPGVCAIAPLAKELLTRRRRVGSRIRKRNVGWDAIHRLTKLYLKETSTAGINPARLNSLSCHVQVKIIDRREFTDFGETAIAGKCRDTRLQPASEKQTPTLARFWRWLNVDSFQHGLD